MLRQPVFGNPLITNQDSRPLGLNGKSEGNALANACYSKIGDFWNLEKENWKGLSELSVSFRPINRLNRKFIIDSIPWDPATASSKPAVGDWVNKREFDRTAPMEWVYQITDTTRVTTSAREFKKLSNVGRIQATSSHDIIIPFEGFKQVRVLAQEGHGATLKLAKDVPPPGKRPPIFWIFESGFISELPWDPGDWHWQQTGNMGDAPFFGYSAKKGYRNARRKQHTPNIITFVQQLNLHNLTIAQVIAKMWHNAHPRKVGALTWLILNNGLPTGIWLQIMGISATCKGYDQGLTEST